MRRQQVGEVRQRVPGIVPDGMRKRRRKGTGSLWFRRSDQRWIGELTVKGERQQVSALDYQEAEDLLDELASVTRVRQGTPRRQPTARWAERLVNQYAAWWLDSIEGSVRPITHRGYERILRIWVVPTIGHLVLGELNSQGAAIPIRTAMDKRKAASTVRNIRTVVHSMLDQAVADGALPANPLAKIRVPEATLRGAHVRADEDVINAIEDAVGEGDTVADMVRLALLVGARLGELTALRWEDVVWRTADLHIERTATVDAHGKRAIGPPKTELSRRKIGLSDVALDILRRRWVEQGRPRDGWIFPALRVRRDQPVQPTWVTATMQKRLRAAGVPVVRFHDLRHMAVLQMLNEGQLDTLTVARYVGHQSPAVTTRIYGAGTVTDRQREAAEVLARRHRPHNRPHR